MQLREDLLRKAKLQRGVHSYFEEQTQAFAIAWRIGALVVPAIMAFVAIADSTILAMVGIEMDAERARAILGVLGVIWFVVSVLADTFGIQERHREHRRAVERYTELLRDLKKAPISDEEDASLLAQYEKRYLEIAESSRKVMDSCFDKGEAGYRRRQARRAARREHPFAMPWTLEKLARKKAQQLVSD